MTESFGLEPLFTTNLFLWIVIGVLSAMFFLASTLKIFAWNKKMFARQIEFLAVYGLNRKVFFLIGVVELFGSLAIWFQGHYLGLLGGGAIALTSAGAIFYHFRFDPIRVALPAIVTLTLSGLIVLHNIDHIWAYLVVAAAT